MYMVSLQPSVTLYIAENKTLAGKEDGQRQHVQETPPEDPNGKLD